MKSTNLLFSVVLSFIFFLSYWTDLNPTYTLTTSVVGERSITHSSGEFKEGGTIILTSTPKEGWVFDSWGGDGNGTSSTSSITMERNKSVVGNFTERLYPLTITIAGEGSVDEQFLSQRKSSQYTDGTIVELIPSPGQEWKFVGWSGDVSSTDEVIEVIIDKETNVTVTFAEINLPCLTTTAATGITTTTATRGGEITDDGNAEVAARGVVWGTSRNPTLVCNSGSTSNGSGTGSFTSNLSNLTPNTRYYVRAYTTNSAGTAFGDQVEFTSDHMPNWPRDTETTIVDVTNPATGRIWMDRNLGASRAATSSTDTQAYGDLFQWGRAADGHQKRNSGMTSTLSSSDQPGHGDFILAPNSPYDWRSPQNDNLWKGVDGISNPCPDGYRLPTRDEWDAERQSWSSRNATGAFASPLRLPVAGTRWLSSGSLSNVGSLGRYWSGTADGALAWLLVFSSSLDFMESGNRPYGRSVRCIKDCDVFDPYDPSSERPEGREDP